MDFTKERGPVMSDQELLESFIQNRIAMLLADFKQSQQDGQTDNSSRAQTIIDNLPEKEKEIVENYINQIIGDFGSYEPFLYKQAFLDGIKVMRQMMKL